MRLATLAVLVLAAPLPSPAQDGGTPLAPAPRPQLVPVVTAPVDDPGLVVPLATGARGLVLLVDGTALEGRVVRIDGDRATLRVDPERRTRSTPPASIVVHPLREIRGFVPLTAKAGDGSQVRVVLDDGGVVGGQRLDDRGERWVLTGEAGERIYPRARVRSVHVVEVALAVSLPGDRHVQVPSAVLPPPRRLRISANQGVHVVATYGVAEHLTVEVGTALPFLHADAYGANVQAAVRAGLEVLPGVAVAGGLHLDAGQPGHASARLSANLTGRTAWLVATIYAGPTFAAADALAGLGDLSVALAATARATRRLDVNGELWLSERDGARDGLGIVTVRTHFSRLSIDLGASLALRDREVGPWIGVAFDVVR